MKRRDEKVTCNTQALKGLIEKRYYPQVPYVHFTLNQKVQVGTKDNFGNHAGLLRGLARPLAITAPGTKY